MPEILASQEWPLRIGINKRSLFSDFPQSLAFLAILSLLLARNLEKLKKLGALALMTLLLYNVFGLAVTIVFFDAGDPNFSPQISAIDPIEVSPYGTSYSEYLNTRDTPSDLIRIKRDFYDTENATHRMDTLCLDLKSNLGARDRFLELVRLIESLTQSEENGSQGNRMIHLLNHLFKLYFPMSFQLRTSFQVEITLDASLPCYRQLQGYTSYEAGLGTPPPEA